MTQTYTHQLHARLEQGASKLDAAYAVILQMILDNTFTAGQVISERSLGAQLGISRTPVRAALNRLALEGYVDLRADVCTVVAEMDLRDILELYEIREALECKAVELFVHRKTPEDERELLDCFAQHKRAVAGGETAQSRELDNAMHLLIARGSRNRRLYGQLANTITLSQRSAAIGSSYEYRYDRSLPQHEAVIAAIVRGDAPAAVEGMRTHMADVRCFFKENFMDGY